MKSNLGALLLRNNAISPALLEKAEERQLVYGGTLDTALLETEALTEAVLLRFLPRANQVPLALPEELIDTDQVSLQLCSRELAERHAIVPLRVVAETLRVLVVDPVDMEALATLADDLALAIEPVIVPEYRWQVAFAARFGSELAPRYVTLAQPAKHPVAPHGLAAATDEALAVQSRTRTGRNTQPGTGAALTRAITTKTPASGEPTAAERLAAMAGEEGAPTPISVHDAIRALGRADERDDIILLVQRALRSRAEWAGLLTVRDDVASGRTALAALGFDSESIAYASLPLDVPSSLASAVQSRNPVSGPLAANSPVFDAQLARFGGADATNALFLPIALRDRVMAVFVAHRGERELSASDVLELLPLGPAAAAAFERAIAKKRPTPRLSKQPRTVPIEPVAMAEIAADARTAAAPQTEGPRSTHVHTVPSRTGTTSPPALAALAPAPVGARADASSRRPSSVPPAPPRAALSVEEAEAFLHAIEAASPREQQAELATLGVAAASLAPHLLRLFPGTLRASRLEVPETDLRAATFGGLVTVLAAMGPDAAEPIAQLLVDESRDRRFFAALAAIDARPRDCIDLLADRLFDQDHGVRAAAAAALRGFAPREVDVALMRVRHALHHGDLEMMRAACDAAAWLGDALAVPELIELFARGPRQSALARRALIAITRHDLGEEGGPWRDWWADNEKRHRVEWLIDAIERTDLPLRNAAAEDLRQLAARHPELAPPEGSFLYSPLAWKMWWATITGAGARVRVSTAPPFGRPKTNPSTP